MLKYDETELRNLEEQVEKNKNDIQDFKDANQTIAEFGIYVQGILSDISLLPETGENFGDAYLIGTKTPYDMRVWTRKDGGAGEWVDLGSFPLQGPKGDRGEIGSVISTGNGDPTLTPTRAGDYYLNVTTGELFESIEPTIGIYGWSSVGSLKGPRGERGERGYQGIRGERGERGAVGAVGPRGERGERGAVGPSLNIQGTLTSTSQLPTPTAEMQDKGYAYVIPNNEGTKHLWVIEGAQDVGPFTWIDLGIAGVEGPQGPAGKGIDTLTDVNLTLGDTTVQYDTTDGVQITSTGRFTYENGQKDVTVDLDVPIVAGSNISIDKASNKEQVVIKTIDSPTFDTLTLNSDLVLGEEYTNFTSVIESPSHNHDITFRFTYADKSEVKLSELLKSANVKTLFGNQSIVGSGNIDLYRHLITLTCYSSTGRLVANVMFISSKPQKIDSLTDLFTAMSDYADTDSYPASGYGNGGYDGTVIVGIQPSTEGGITVGDGTLLPFTEEFGSAQGGMVEITDTVTTV